MLGKKASEVLVVGGGPTGLFTALLLAERGVAVEVIDGAGPPPDPAEALCLHPASLELLDDVGVAADLIVQGRPLETIAIVDEAGLRGRMQLSALPTEFPFLLTLPAGALCRALERRLAERRVPVRWNHRLAALDAAGTNGRPGDAVVATVHRLGQDSSGYVVAKSEWVVEKVLEVSARFVVGADGSHSVVRRELDAALEAVGPAECYATGECDCPPGWGDDLRIMMGAQGRAALWPLPGGRARWSLELSGAPDGGEAAFGSVSPSDRYAGELDGELLAGLVAERAPAFGEVRGLTAPCELRFERRLADTFGRGPIWLAGDAARLTGPLGGQSLNVGLREAHELAWRLTRVLRGSAAMELLAQYDRSRRAEWSFLLELQGGLHGGPGVDPAVARASAQFLPCIPGSGEALAAMAGQIGLVASIS